MILKFNLPGNKISIDIEDDTPTSSPYERIWNGYLRLRLQDLTVRSGMILYGAYPQMKGIVSPTAKVATLLTKDKFDYTGAGTKHPETVSMHTLGCIGLLCALIDEFPKLFVCEPRPINFSRSHREVLQIKDRLITLFLVHDGGEPFEVDFPDDGSWEKEMKNAIELEYFKINIRNISCREVKIQLIKDFVGFQNPTVANLFDGWRDYDQKIVQLAKLIDKVDAIFATLKNEKEGHPGFISKKEEITTQDQYFIDLCGTSAIADCWAAHFVANYHEFYGFDIIMNLLYVAVVDTRGKWYTWWDKFCEAYPTVKFTPPR